MIKDKGLLITEKALPNNHSFRSGKGRPFTIPGRIFISAGHCKKAIILASDVFLAYTLIRKALKKGRFSTLLLELFALF